MATTGLNRMRPEIVETKPQHRLSRGPGASWHISVGSPLNAKDRISTKFIGNSASRYNTEENTKTRHGSLGPRKKYPDRDRITTYRNLLRVANTKGQLPSA